MFSGGGPSKRKENLCACRSSLFPFGWAKQADSAPGTDLGGLQVLGREPLVLHHSPAGGIIGERSGAARDKALPAFRFRLSINKI